MAKIDTYEKNKKFNKQTNEKIENYEMKRKKEKIKRR